MSYLGFLFLNMNSIAQNGKTHSIASHIHIHRFSTIRDFNVYFSMQTLVATTNIGELGNLTSTITYHDYEVGTGMEFSYAGSSGASTRYLIKWINSLVDLIIFSW